MSKIQKTAKEIEALVMEAARKVPECESLTGVTVRGVEDERVHFNWEVSHCHNSSSYCDIAIKTIVAGMQRVIDLKDVN